MPESGSLLAAALTGIATGGVYALLAAALALIQGKLRLIDFSHALGLLLGVFGLLFLLLNFGVDPVKGLPVAAVLGMMGGFAAQRVGAGTSAGPGDRLLPWIALLVIGEFSLLDYGGGAFSPWEARSEPVAFGFEFQPARAIALFLGLLGCALLARTIRGTDFGRSVRARLAADESGRGAQNQGIDATAFGIAGASLAAGACLLVPSNGLQLQAAGGFLPVVLALAVLGSRGHLRDALSGGLLIGLIESVGRASLGDGPGLLFVVAIALVLLLGHTGRLFPARGYFPSELQ